MNGQRTRDYELEFLFVRHTFSEKRSIRSTFDSHCTVVFVAPYILFQDQGQIPQILWGTCSLKKLRTNWRKIVRQTLTNF